VPGHGEVVVSERVTNESDRSLEYMWAHHPAFGAPLVAPGTRIRTSATTIFADTSHDGPGNRLLVSVWVYLLILTAIEVFLTYLQVFRTEVMLLILMILSAIKAGLIIAYFMHLRFEKTSLILSIIPAGMLVIALLFAFFPDSYRALALRP